MSPAPFRLADQNTLPGQTHALANVNEDFLVPYSWWSSQSLDMASTEVTVQLTLAVDLCLLEADNVSDCRLRLGPKPGLPVLIFQPCPHAVAAIVSRTDRRFDKFPHTLTS